VLALVVRLPTTPKQGRTGRWDKAVESLFRGHVPGEGKRLSPVASYILDVSRRAQAQAHWTARGLFRLQREGGR